MLFRALALSLQSLLEGRILAILFKTLVISLLIFGVAGAALWLGLQWLFARWDFNDYGLAAIGALTLTLLFGWILWRVTAIAVLWFFSDDIVDAVEARHYPAHALSGKRPGGLQSGRMALRSVGRALGYNLLALPLYLILLITGIGTSLVFLLVNALLLGRDLQDMLEARHGRDRVGFDGLSRLMLGAAGTAAMLLPMVNLLVPVVATAMAVHMAHIRKAR